MSKLVDTLKTDDFCTRLIEGEVLERIETRDPIATKWNGVFEIWEEPEENVMYMLGVDPSEGTGNDNSCVQVLKINSEFDIKQVAVYRNNMIEPYNFAQICISISEYYNGCYMMVENNNVGQIVADAIWWDFEYKWRQTAGFGWVWPDPDYKSYRLRHRSEEPGCGPCGSRRWD